MKRVLLLTAAALIALAALGIQCGDPEFGDLRQPRRSRLHRHAVSRPERRAGCQRHGNASILGLNNAPLVLITASTPGASGYPNNLIGYCGNDGTDYFELDQAYPISGNGLLFDVGTTTAEWGLHPLFAIWSEGNGYGAAFTGQVAGTEYWNIQGSAAAGAVPEPSTWAMFGIGFAGLVLRAGGRAGRTGWL